jgi:hypothetical protein
MSKRTWDKQGQITIFIIAGIVVLLGAGVYYGVKDQIIRDQISPDIEFAVDQVPIEFRPVYSLVETCLRDIATEGLVKLGEKGGFIDLVENGIITRADATSSDAVVFFPGSDYSVPYWWYLSSDNSCEGNCEFDVVPRNKLYLTKESGQVSIEGQVEGYIYDNLRTCLNNFESVNELGFEIKELGDIEPTVTIGTNDIITYITYPIEATRSGKEEISTFFVRLPLNLANIYGAALQITNLQGEFRFIEKDVLNLMSGHSGVDSEKLPPMYDSKFRIGHEVTWDREDVNGNLINLLSSNIQLLRMYGTRNYEPYIFPGSSLFESLYNNGMLVPGSDAYSNLNVKFDYNPWWGIYFDINCDETCRPESIATDLVTLLGVQNYNFVYDLSFPVEVEIHDPFAFNNRGYTFKLFLEGNIRDNDVLKSDFSPLEGVSSESTMLCDENKRNSGDITINAKDYMTNLGVDDVSIVFSSLDETCLIGSTVEGEFVGKLPVMLGGVVNFVKEGYLTYSQRFDTKLNRRGSLNVVLNPELTRKFSVRKKKMSKNGGVWGNPSGDFALSDSEEVLITLTRQDNLQDGTFSTSGNYIWDQAEKGEILIVPGKYEIDINLMYNDPIKIPSRTIEVDDDDYNVEEILLDEGFRVGGVAFNYTFTKDNLENDEIVFYVLNADIVSVPENERIAEDLAVVSDVDAISLRYRASLLPRFK